MSASLQNVLSESAIPNKAPSQISGPSGPSLAAGFWVRPGGFWVRGEKSVAWWTRALWRTAGLCGLRLPQPWGPWVVFTYPHKHPLFDSLTPGFLQRPRLYLSIHMVPQSTSRPEWGEGKPARFLTGPLSVTHSAVWAHGIPWTASAPQETGNFHQKPPSAMSDQVCRPPSFPESDTSRTSPERLQLSQTVPKKLGEGSTPQTPRNFSDCF